ncbi:Uncharacterised protein [Streptococcus pneumoniae]|nr:Uncharacterised protein [Streptococcus pneumoniae]
MEIKPCSTGSFVLAAAAAIGAEPRPDSFENTPRAKAEVKTKAIVPGIFPILKKITVRVPKI